MARLGPLCAGLGLRGAPIRRVLEWGPGRGEHLLPQAALLPEVEFVGWEPDPALRAAGRRATTLAGLANVRWVDAPPDDTVDLVISRSQLAFDGPSALPVVARWLGDEGVAALGCAAQPGWQLFSSIRDVLRWHTAHLPEAQHAASARDLVRLLDDALLEEPEPHAAWIHAIRLGFEGVDDDWIAREFLARPIEAMWFHRLVDALAAVGLRYATEAKWHTTRPENFPASIAEILLETSDPVEREQSMDLLRAKAWRQVVVARRGGGEMSVPTDVTWVSTFREQPAEPGLVWVSEDGYPLVPDTLDREIFAPEGSVVITDDPSTHPRVLRAWGAGVVEPWSTPPGDAGNAHAAAVAAALSAVGAPLSTTTGRAANLSARAIAAFAAFAGTDPRSWCWEADVLAEARAARVPVGPAGVL